MSFLRHQTERVYIKTEAECSAPAYAIGLSYSLLSCSPAELNSASLNNSNVINLNSTVYFTLPIIEDFRRKTLPPPSLILYQAPQ